MTPRRHDEPELQVSSEFPIRPSSFRLAVAQLERLQRRLRLNGITIALTTLLNIGVSLIAFFPAIGIVGLSFRALLAATTMLVTIVIVGVIWHEGLRKTGDAMFEEISDEYQRISVRKGTKRISSESATGEQESRPKHPGGYLSARIVLRSFAASADLPLIPGKFGPGFYALINIVILVATFVFAVTHRPSM